MPMSRSRTVCWTPTWNKAHEGVGLEHLLLDQGAADSVVLAVDEERGPFRLTYHLAWDHAWRLREAELVVAIDRSTQSLSPDLRVQPQPQAYTRLGERLYLFQNLDGSGFSAELPVDEDGIVLDYPALFRRVTPNR